ncbi:MAG: xylulose 5-phosphate 3-epimerase, partial [Marinobacter sp.]|nr:xylulose 5-phosphate 3-epimerase [Marinobacter sp.]
MYAIDQQNDHRTQQRAKLYRDTYPAFARWSEGYGVIQHRDETQVRVFDLCQQLLCTGRFRQIDEVLEILSAADRLATAAMWLVVHMTYTNKVNFNGSALDADDFKSNPQGHTGG